MLGQNSLNRSVALGLLYLLGITFANADNNRYEAYNQPSAESIVINEIMPANIDMFVDKSGNYGGFVEIYNPTDKPVRLLNMYVSDEADNLRKFRLKASAGVAPAKGFCVIWFDHNGGDGDFFLEADAQVPFKLDYNGGAVYISDSEGNLIAMQKYPKAASRVSWARKTDGGAEWGSTAQPTPGKSNMGVTFAETQLPVPVPDTDGGFFDPSFTLHVSFPEDSQLLYTTDGSTPTIENGKISPVGAFRVSSGSSHIYRFRLFREGFLPSEVVTRSFIYRDKDYTLPMVSIVSDDKNFRDDSLGVLVSGHFSNYNKDWDRPVNLEYFNAGECLANMECDFAISGAFSRSAEPRPFRIKANKLYRGINTIDTHFFPSKQLLKTKSIRFRNGGNDVSNRIKDGAVQEIIQRSGFYVDGQLWNPMHVFINGKYHGMLNAREPANKFYAYSNYGADTDNLDAFEYDPGTGYYQKDGNKEMFLKWFNMTYEAEDEGVYNEICKIVDIDEYCNYMAAGCWLGSNDWIANNNNVKGFRERTDDGRFHFVMYDFDAAFALTDYFSEMTEKVNNLNYIGGKNYMIQSLFNLLKNKQFLKKFVTAYCLVAGSVYEPTRSSDIIHDMLRISRPALQLEGLDNTSAAEDIIKQISNTNNRNARMNALSKYLSLGESHRMKFYSSLPEAQFLLNGEWVPTAKFDGVLYGAQTIEALSPAGYNFVGWRRMLDNTIISTDRVLKYAAISGTEFKAEFEPIADDELENAGALPVVINEVSASNSIFCNEYYNRNDWVELYNNTDSEIDVNGMYMSDDKDNLKKFQINASGDVNTIIPPHGHLVVWCDKLEAESFIHASFKLANADNECIILTSADGAWSDCFRYMKHIGTHSFGRFPDGGKCVYDMTRPTPAGVNQLTSQSILAYGDNVNQQRGAVADVDEVYDINPDNCQYYSVSGTRLPTLQKGVNIIRLADGTTKKVIAK